MALYKDLNGNIHDDADGMATHLLPAGCTCISEFEAKEILAPSQEEKDAAEIEKMIQAEIRSIAVENLKSKGALTTNGMIKK